MSKFVWEIKFPVSKIQELIVSLILGAPKESQQTLRFHCVDISIEQYWKIILIVNCSQVQTIYS